MKELFYKQLNKIIKVILPENYFAELIISDFHLKYIPECYILLESNTSDFQLELFQAQDFDFQLIVEENLAKISGPLDLNLPSKEAVIVLVDYIFEYLRGFDCVYSVHGSAFSYLNKGYLMLGQMSGLGKTSLTLSMVLNYGASFIGDDKILINGTKIVGGAKKIHFNKIELFKQFGNQIHESSIKDIQQIIKFQNGDSTLDKIIFPICVKGAEFYYRELSEADLEFALYEEMSRKIRGISKRIADKYPIASIDTVEISINRLKIAKKIAKKVKGIYITGDIESITNYISTR